MILEIIFEVYDIYSSTSKIRQMVCWNSKVEVLRCGYFVSIDSDDIVPGDVVKIVSGHKIPADILIIQGQSIVSESMLTGESVPLMKDAIKMDEIVLESKHVLFYGSEVMHVESNKGKYALGLVLTTN